MAYWMTHLRVAEALLRCLPEGISLPHYYAGSIAPDCGRTEWNEDGTPRYLPGRVVTHWLKKDEALDRCLIDFEGFYNAMMPQAADDGARAFYWGYYIHLITDAMWQERVLRPRRESLADPSKENIAAMRADLKQIIYIFVIAGKTFDDTKYQPEIAFDISFSGGGISLFDPCKQSIFFLFFQNGEFCGVDAADFYFIRSHAVYPPEFYLYHKEHASKG